MRRARFPRETIPAAAVTVQLVTFVPCSPLLVPLSLALRGTHTPAALLLLPVIVVLLFALRARLRADRRGAARLLPRRRAGARPPRCCRGSSSPRSSTSPTRASPFVAHHPAVATLLDWVNPIAPFIHALRDILVLRQRARRRAAALHGARRRGRRAGRGRRRVPPSGGRAGGGAVSAAAAPAPGEIVLRGRHAHVQRSRRQRRHAQGPAAAPRQPPGRRRSRRWPESTCTSRPASASA